MWKAQVWGMETNLGDLAAPFTALPAAAQRCPSPFCYPLQAVGPGPLGSSACFPASAAPSHRVSCQDSP